MKEYFFLKNDKTKIFLLEGNIFKLYVPDKNIFCKTDIRPNISELMPIDPNEDIKYFYFYNLAYKIAKNAHKGQKDKSEKDYFTFHVLEVCRKVKGRKQKITALLHDIVEDTDITLFDLENFGFDKSILNAVSSITKCKNEDYFTYIQRVKKDKIARDVKLSDLMHNSNLKRLKKIEKKDIKRKEKYLKAIDILMQN